VLPAIANLATYWTQVLLMAATAWRATHLIVEDDFPPIRWVRRRLVAGGPEWLGDLVSCTWCTSVWVAAAVTVAADLYGSLPRPWFVFGFVAASVPLLEAVVSCLEREPGTTAPPGPGPTPPPPTTYARTRG
jgi:Protein of unknown function (DUF1360)